MTADDTPDAPPDSASDPAPKAAEALMVVVLDSGGRLVSLNPAAERLSGLRTREVAGEPIWERLVAPEDRDAIRTMLTGEGDPSAPRQVRWCAPDGTLHEISCTHTPVLAGDGSVAYVVCAGFDVAARQGVLDALAEREARLKAILDTAVEGIITIDERGIIESVNPATERIFGHRAESMIGRNIDMLMPEPYASSHDEYLAAYRASGVRRIIGIGREVEGLRSDGSIFPLDLAISEFTVGGRHRYTGIVRDITARKHAEREARRHVDELAHAARVLALGEMTSGIAHEVNQPLAAIVSYAQAYLRILDGGGADPAMLREVLGQIAAQGQRAGDIIRHLRQLVRKEAAERHPVSISTCVRDVLGLLRHDVNAHQVHVELSLESGLPKPRADRIQIEQVILNLVRNALEAMREADVRRLSLATRRSAENGVEVAVSDTGRGLDGEPAEKLFETFYTTKRDGMGVGLSISRSIIETYGGRLWAEENPRGGLTFRFTLPRHVPDGA